MVIIAQAKSNVKGFDGQFAKLVKLVDIGFRGWYTRADMDGKELEQRRIAAALTRAELAARLGVSRQTVWNWETGQAPIPGPAAKLIRLLLPLNEELVFIRQALLGQAQVVASPRPEHLPGD